ncbi:MAG: hypothetical protein OEW23_02900 [Candidatus Aminicenantes bacterium]|nr:hypothetical protein [Candidatus Aminicenantes bacterium]
MKKYFSILFSFLCVMSFFSCGKKGNILPPLIRLPQMVEEIQAAQRADSIFLTWKNPTAYVDGSALLELERIEIWVLVTEKDSDNETSGIGKEEFQQNAVLAISIESEKVSGYLVQEHGSDSRMSYSYDLSGQDYVSKHYTFGLRIKDRKRYSDFSDLVSLEPLLLSLPPQELVVLGYQDRIEITWIAPLQNIDHSSPANFKGYNVYRSEGEETPRRLNSDLVMLEKYDDKNFSFAQKYRYFIRTSATDTAPFFESQDSEVVEIMTRDTFAPHPPKGLLSVGGMDVIAIRWDENNEEDLNGYRVWRREEKEKEFRLLTPQQIKENAFSDTAVEKDKRYYYAITALDEAGNESQKSEIISDMIRERLP